MHGRLESQSKTQPGPQGASAGLSKVRLSRPKPRSKGPARRCVATEYRVQADLPALLPVTEAELELLERELLPFIAGILRTA